MEICFTTSLTCTSTKTEILSAAARVLRLACAWFNAAVVWSGLFFLLVYLYIHHMATCSFGWFYGLGWEKAESSWTGLWASWSNKKVTYHLRLKLKEISAPLFSFSKQSSHRLPLKYHHIPPQPLHWGKAYSNVWLRYQVVIESHQCVLILSNCCDLLSRPDNSKHFFQRPLWSLLGKIQPQPLLIPDWHWDPSVILALFQFKKVGANNK